MSLDHILDRIYWNNSLRVWLTAFFVFCFLFGFLKILSRVSVGRLKAFASKTETQWDDFFVSLLDKTKSFFFFFLALILAAWLLELGPRTWKFIKSASMIAFCFQGLFWGREAISFLIEMNVAKREAIRGNDPSLRTTFGVIRFVSSLALYAIVVLLILDNLGFNVTTLIAGLGVGGIAVALATQNILGDLFASLSIVLDKPFVVGDYIELGVTRGNVERIGLKSTRLRGVSGEQVVVSNTELMNGRIQNFGRIQRRRVIFSVGVEYATSSDKLLMIPKVIEDTVRLQEMASFDRAHLKTLAESSLNFEVVYFVESGDIMDYVRVEQAINLRLISEFSRLGIQFAFPSRTVFVQKGDANAAYGQSA